jgi:hypothetical protein
LFRIATKLTKIPGLAQPLQPSDLGHSWVNIDRFGDGFLLLYEAKNNWFTIFATS